ncbi:MAG: hypothetical protein ACR2LI_01615 [Propionibacteriaceae bacterium]
MTSISQPSSDPATTDVPSRASARAALRERVARLQAERPETVPTQHLSPAPGRIRLSGLS